jgi:3-deoxy-7-phosphoheptulonate synthase
MMIVMKEDATREQIASVVKRVENVGAHAHISEGELLTVIGAIGDRERIANLDLTGADGVDRVVPITKPYKLASSQFKHGVPSVLEIDGRRIGGGHFSLIAGPCTVESREQLLATAEAVKQGGASMLRGGAYKPRTSPYSFQGLGGEGLRLLKEAKEQTGLPIVTELMDQKELDQVLEVADVVQVGARSMQNYTLLAELGRAGRPVLLKRGLSATLEELLMAAEYILKEGNEDVILCERGRDLVLPLSLAAAAAGADGIIVEVHNNPEAAICDGPQAVPADDFAQYAEQLQRVAAVVGNELSAL